MMTQLLNTSGLSRLDLTKDNMGFNRLHHGSVLYVREDNYLWTSNLFNPITNYKYENF